MSMLVVGASGATGRLLVRQLLDRGQEVRAVVRSDRALADLEGHARLTRVQASLLELGDAELLRLVRGCSAVACCLGHTPNLRGIYGAPRRLVTDATRRLCEAMCSWHAENPHGSERPLRFVLMNTAGNSNRDLREPASLAQRGVIALVRLLVPPHADNEQAADYLRLQVGQNHPAVEWSVVRPDRLTDGDQAGGHEAHASPVRSPLFDAGRTCRAHVAQFMADLLLEDAAWEAWKGRMPVLYSQGRA